ncbi:MAG: hypothetical protein JKY80_04285 [Mariprofundaceae bacterium]|nr:hypothetical protein [Mariprofundaceae bacterium]
MSHKWYGFDPRRNFISLPIVWITIGLFFISSGLMAGLIIANENLEYLPTSEGFNNLITVFKVPLGTLAVLIPIIALLAANHRSGQTKEQISHSDEQTNFTNYYKHLEEFEKFIANPVLEKWVEIQRVRAMHDKLFPFARDGGYAISDDSIRLVQDNFDNIKKALEYFLEGHPISVEDTLLVILKGLWKVEGTLGVRWRTEQWSANKHNNLEKGLRDSMLKSDGGVTTIEIGNRSNLVVPRYARKWFLEVRLRAGKILEIMEFGRGYIPPESLIKISKLYVNVMPACPMDTKLVELDGWDFFKVD